MHERWSLRHKIWYGHFRETLKKNCYFVSLVSFLSILCFSTPLWYSSVLCWSDSVLFLGKVRFSHVMGNEKVRNICFFTKQRNMAIFYRAVRHLVDFSLVTKLTRHVSKVRETVRKCEKIRQNDCKTFFMTSDSQKMVLRFWIPIFVQNSRFHNQAGTLTRR